jgi:hypothetical protein
MKGLSVYPGIFGEKFMGKNLLADKCQFFLILPGQVENSTTQMVAQHFVAAGR